MGGRSDTGNGHSEGSGMGGVIFSEYGDVGGGGDEFGIHVGEDGIFN